MTREFKSALRVNKGVHQPENINGDALHKHRKAKRKTLAPGEYLDGILTGNRTILSQAITLIESNLPRHQEVAQEVIEKCLGYAGNSVRIGITGVPGVGKSTFIEALGNKLIRMKRKLAVLAIDPSSEYSKGSILGDKTRMEKLSAEINAYIRPSPSAGTLGGVARKTRETIVLCEAAGFDTIFVETVGVGQSETAVHSMVDFFLLLMLAGAGDELQGVKRGIMEMADTVVITKFDGDNKIHANRAKAEYQNALHLYPPTKSGWTPEVLICSAKDGTGISHVWETIDKYCRFTRANKFLEQKRKSQSLYWMYETINDKLKDRFYQHPEIIKQIKKYRKMVLSDKISSFVAARQLLDKYFPK
ncbi:MAG: methylmalonyl Co-A mutase-associated GTPase MeaB [Bacteroidetes bacterium]|nr:methylmalonyl Co-A mutase-associated GTPase MeaB [Bacteroidota bacterium]